MAFSRKSTLAAVAGSLSLAVLTGCPQAPGAVGTPTPTPTATTAPTTAPTDPGATASPGEPGATPTTTPSEANIGNTTLRGTVYDVEGARVNGAKVTVKSLNPSNPFESTVDVINGTYVVNEVPAGVQLEITATRDGWTSRNRVETLIPLNSSNEPNIVNFGGVKGGDVDTEGRSYFISKYPEISMVEPAEDATNVDPTKLTVTLTLSEALDTTNQRRFEDAIRVLPANQYAISSGAAVGATNAANVVGNWEDQASASLDVDGAFAASNASGAYVVKENTTFLGDDDTRATIAWSEEGKVATLTFNAPLLANEDNAAKYAIALVSPGSVIEDKDGNDLGFIGTTATSWGGYAGNTGNLLSGTFREADLAVPSDVANGLPLWAATHTALSTFEVSEDDTTPTLTGVTVTELASTTRITFTFSEPMAAFAGPSTAAYGETWMSWSNITSATAGSADVLDNFTFAVAETSADLDDVELDGDGATVYRTNNTNGIGDVSGERETEFYIAPAQGGATMGFSINPDDAKQFRMVVNSASVFSNTVNSIKARVEGISDPAGNQITDTQADNNVQVGSI